ncbi:sigma-70 family RNA polymerase sigma factor [Gordonia sp. UCD-TK1]|uniref:sigma-70 family RNA polymerase sigma factor n=1 Tax=Gordonia sp. UCD-TK1 TaxID=1857893 RepID=UPI00080DD116|nr:sigma-70 family RNA polymerase sigma factor [Gordonia sp. UCD-TK1]OCH78787.1 RNA polymerase subunit sigma-70 [Gordonia sp. UCD-TK1]
MVPTSEFEDLRPQLTAMAFRMLGSIHDAEDAVQSTWLNSVRVDGTEIRNPAAWLTTTLTRVCLDQLRARGRRREDPLFADALPAEAVAADELYLQRENVSRALMVVLDRLTPSQRVAYVLHDLFAVPFGEVATVLGTSVDGAKKHASRARGRIASSRLNSELDPELPSGDASLVVDAFLAAARGGSLDAMVALLAENCIRVADRSLVPPDTPTVVRGARAVAEETRLFVDRIRASTPMWLGGRMVHVIAPGGHPLAVIDIAVKGGRVVRIDIRRMTSPAVSR